jgi:hypothetical protein
MNRHDREQLDRMEVLLQRLDSAVVVRDLGSARAAEAFDGLRKSVIQASKSHRVHVAHLIALDESIRSGGTLDLVRLRVAEYLRELGIERLESPEILEAFDIVGDVDGDIEVLEAAIVERGDEGRTSILRVGKARRTARPSVTQGSRVDTATEVSEISSVVPSSEGDPVPNLERSSGGRSRLVLSAIGLVFVGIVTLSIRACESEQPTPAPADEITTTTLSTASDS